MPIANSSEVTIMAETKIKETKTKSGTESSLVSPPDFQKLVDVDNHIGSFKDWVDQRYTQYHKLRQDIEASEGSLEKFSRGYENHGFFKRNGKIVYREWAPCAEAASLIGGFNNWNRESNKMVKDNFGNWEVELPAGTIPHLDFVKVSFRNPFGEWMDRIPAWINYAVQNNDEPVYTGCYYDPPEKFEFKVKERPVLKTGLRIYEAHVGISSQEPTIASYKHFAENIIPRIKKNGYNAIQLMAIMEHAYYGSFGYQVSNFFAASSRFGTPDDLKFLVDTAHAHGLIVLLDVVHSHASKNVADGLNKFDGSDHCYFHEGATGEHSLWDSRLFNYGHWEVLRFLLSNLRWWMEEYMFDGFRFDGVSSMLYKHHGIGYGFSGGYHEYFGDTVDNEALVYLMLANAMLHELYRNVITVAEDVSGMPALCRPVSEGGGGFDYRLAMAVPDKWIELIKELNDDEWDMGNIVHALTNRRHGEKTIAYCESHDQALVGDKTLAFWLMDKDMYTNMSVISERTLVISRGMALHKMIRLLTYGLAGEGYLNFIGNEWGHPEWLDFPRVGNNESYFHARRQWNCLDDDLLRYQFLNNFDGAMHKLEDKYDWLNSPQAYVSLKHENDKIIVFERANVIFAFNFHPTKSFDNYRIGANTPGCYRIVLSSDDKIFDGFEQIETSCDYFTEDKPWHDRQHSLLVYLPSRTCIVLALKETV